MRKKFAKKVEFISKFSFLRSLTRTAKEKLWFFLDKEVYTLGQNVYNEGDPTKYIYFIETGEFEIKKCLYFKRLKEEVICEFLRFYSTEDVDFLSILFDPASEILYSDQTPLVCESGLDENTDQQILSSFSAIISDCKK